MNYILSDASYRNAFLPFTFTRPLCDIRIGIDTVREKWSDYLDRPCSALSESYLREKFPLIIKDDNIVINASFLPNSEMAQAVTDLGFGEMLVKDEEWIAYRSSMVASDMEQKDFKTLPYKGDATQIKHTWDIFRLNGEVLEADFERITAGRHSEPLSPYNRVIRPERIFLERGAKVEHCILNASTGPIYIGKDAEVMEGSSIRGGFAMGPNSVVKMAAKIYGPTSVGPYCKIGGELNNVIMFGYSSKAHDGFLGNAVLGEWCNMGADTNNSNLKNNYAPVKLWSYETERFEDTGLQFCGLMMGDHSKTAINTMINTGSVIGVSVNLYSAGFPRNFIPSFSWGGANGFTTYRTTKAFETARVAMSRRNVEFQEADARILEHVFELTKTWRPSDN